MQIFIEAALIIVDETTPDDGLISYSYCYRCCCHPRGPSGLAVDNEDNVYVTDQYLLFQILKQT
jgi:hypothetical protein